MINVMMTKVSNVVTVSWRFVLAAAPLLLMTMWMMMTDLNAVAT
jgi:hypothetical protein